MTRRILGTALMVWGLAAFASGQTTPGGQPAGSQTAAAGPSSDAKPNHEKAAAIYKTRCLPCHGAEGKSQLPGMSLADGVWKHGTKVKEISATIANGVPGTPMVSFKAMLKEDEITALAHYIRTFDETLEPESR